MEKQKIKGILISAMFIIGILIVIALFIFMYLSMKNSTDPFQNVKIR